MTNKLYFGALALALFFTGCVREAELQTLPERPEEPQVLREITPEMQAVVEFDDGMISLVEEDLNNGNFLRTKSSDLNNNLKDLGVVRMERVFPYAGEFEERTRREGMHRFYHIVMAEEEATKAVVSLESLPGVLSVEPVHPIRLRDFDDPNFSKQWHYVNKKNPGADIHVQEVWDQYTVGNSQVIVSIVDEPVDPTHPDLDANLWKDASGHTGYNFARNSYDLSIRPESGRGDLGHGTHVAGTVAAVNNNGLGVCGIAGGNYALGIPGVRVQSCAIFSGSMSASDNGSANAIKWGADHGAVISQNSWGYYADSNVDGYVSSSELAAYKKWKISTVMKKAIDYFVKYAGCDNAGEQLPDSPMKGGLVIFACGNENIDYDVMSSYEPVIAVGATGYSGNKASYSCYGDFVDLAAPGGDGTYSIWSTLPTKVASGYGGTTTTNGYGGKDWQGTSMAAPHASGVAALVVSYFGGPGFTAEACKAYLLEGAGEVVGGSKPVGRRLNALGAIEYGIEHHGGAVPHPPVISLESTSLVLSSEETRTVGITVSDPDGDAVTVTCTPGSGALTYDDKTRKATIVGKNAEDGTYKAVFTASDEGGLTASATLEYIISTNHPPIVQIEKEEVTVEYTQTVQVKFSVSDPDGDDDLESISCSAGSKALKMDTEKGVLTITGSGAVEGTYKATIAAVDKGGLVTRASLTYTLLPRNQEPVIEVNPTEITLRGNQTAEALVTWSDPDGDPVTVSCTPGSGALSFDEKTGKVTIQGAEAEPGSYKASFQATDPDGAIAFADLYYTILENHAPVITVDKDQFTLNPLQSASAQVSWSDEDGDAVTVTCIPGSAALSFDPATGKVTIQGNKADAGTYKAVFTAADPLGLSTSIEIFYTLQANHAPVVSVSPASITLRSIESASAQVTWSDQDDWDQLTVSFTAGSDALSFDKNSGKVSIQGGKAPAGTYKAEFTVTDLCGARASAVLDYTIQVNHAPEVTKALDNLVVTGIGQSQELNLGDLFRDPDNDALTLGARLTDGADVIKADISGQTLRLTSTKAGVATVLVEARDAAGESCSTSFQVAVKPTANAVDVYPQPAQDYVYFHVASPTDVQVNINFYTSTGSPALKLTAAGSVFKPVQVDITALAPGRYASELEYGGQVYKSQIIVR